MPYSPLVMRLFPKTIPFKETEHLSEEERTALLDRAINSTEYQTFQKSEQLGVFYAAIMFGTMTLLGTTSFIGGTSLILGCSLFIIIVGLAGLILGLLSQKWWQYIYCWGLTLILTWNVCGFLQYFTLMKLLKISLAAVASYVVFELAFAISTVLFISRAKRLISQLLKQHISGEAVSREDS